MLDERSTWSNRRMAIGLLPWKSTLDAGRCHCYSLNQIRAAFCNQRSKLLAVCVASALLTRLDGCTTQRRRHGHKRWYGKIEAPHGRRHENRGAVGADPLPSWLGSLVNVVSSPSWVWAEPQPLSNFVHFISYNFMHSEALKFRFQYHIWMSSTPVWTLSPPTADEINEINGLSIHYL